LSRQDHRHHDESLDKIRAETEILQQEKRKSAWKEWLAHQGIGVFAGVGVSWQGQYEVPIRCTCLLALFVWLSRDTWKTLKPWKTTQRRSLVVAGLQVLLIVLFLGTSLLIYFASIHQKQRDVFKNLLIQEGHQEDHDDPFSAYFSLTNNSDSTIIKHQASCIVNTILRSNGVQEDRNVIADDKAEIFNTPLQPNGGTNEFKCHENTAVHVSLPISCVDITIRVDYWDDVQSTVLNEPRQIRFFAKREKDGFNWHKEEVNLKKGGCLD
jgi:hypothetical protein